MNIDRIYSPFFRYFRTARNRRFIQLLELTPETTVLDVGGTSGFWSAMPIVPKVTLLNIYKEQNSAFPQVVGSATSLPFPDENFDIVFSNSMIEHLGTIEAQRAAAREMLRVGKRLWVQTPYKWFPVEPHLLTPFIHWLPRLWQQRLRPVTVRGLLTHGTADWIEEPWDDIRLLDISEMQELFPHCRIMYERFGGLVKSLIAWN